MTQTTHLDVGALRARLSGPVLTPQDGEYDEARILWNGAIDRRPAVIAQCAHRGRRGAGGAVRARARARDRRPRRRRTASPGCRRATTA